MHSYTCPRCKAQLRREAPLSNGGLCPECAYQAPGSRKTAELACQLGAYYAEQGQHDKASRAYTEAVQFNANHAAAYAGRASIYFAKKDYPRALNQYTEAIRLDPQRAATYSLRGAAHHEKGDHDRAIADFTRAIE